MAAGKFSRYEIRGELGKGGMAVVYRAYDPRFGREVALKIMRQEMLKDQKLRERFERETRILASLELEGIVPIYDVDQSDEGQLFFVMRLMTGGTLAEQMQNGPLSTSTILRLLQRIAPVLDIAHEKGIIHRDLKPGNILFDEQGHAYIADFGIAKAVSIIAPDTTTGSSGILGTPRYMSPEQGRGESVDGRSDIYSLGVIVFEMLVGKTNFDSVVTPLGLAFTQETNVIHRVLDTNPNLPSGVQAVIEKVLARDHHLRYGTCMEFVTDLINALSETVTPDKPVRSLSSHPAFWAAIGVIILGFLMLNVLRYIPKYQPTPPSQTATATVIPSKTVPAPTATFPPTGTVVPPTAVIDPGVGAANKIAFTANNEIYLSNIDGTGIESLTNTGIPKIELQWLPGSSSKLIYIESNCVYRINTDTNLKESEKVLCLSDPEFTGFRVSPDGTRVAISVGGRLLVMPFDLATLSTASSAFELQKLEEEVCLNYTDVAVKDALWSNDGKRLAIRYQSVVNDRIGDTVRVVQGNWDRCQQAEAFIWDEFPSDHFVPNGYAKYPILPSYGWDGGQRFLMNSFIRNKSYGDLYSYDMSNQTARKINPIDGACCYGTAAYSPDGTYILLVFQDRRKAPDNETQLYYIPADQIGTGTAFTPLPIPSRVFQDWREDIQLALRSSLPGK